LRYKKAVPIFGAAFFVSCHYSTTSSWA